MGAELYSNTHISRLSDVDDFNIELLVEVAKDEEKIASVLYCFSQSNYGYTIKTARECAAKNTSVGEKTVKRIIWLLAYELGYLKFDNKIRKWIATPNMPKFSSLGEAEEFIRSLGLKIR